MNATTLTARAGAALVALIAGFASFRHIVAVALHLGEDTAVAYALPFCIDALMLVAVAAMHEDRRNGRTPRTSARVAFGFGVAASLGANVASAEPTTGARVVAAVPALALLLAIEVLSRVGRSRAVQVPAPDKTSSSAETGKTSSADEASEVARPVRTPAPRKPVRQSAAERVAAAVRRTPAATPAQIAARLHISERTAQRHWPTVPSDDTVSTVDGGNGQPADVAPRVFVPVAPVVAANGRGHG